MSRTQYHHHKKIIALGIALLMMFLPAAPVFAQTGESAGDGADQTAVFHENMTSDSKTTTLTSEQLSAAQATAEKTPEAIVAGMTLDQKLGQMVVPAFRIWTDDSGKTVDVTALNDTLRKMIQTNHLGGLVLFSQNTKDTEQTVRLTDDLQKTIVAGGDLPLMLAVDQEGGDAVQLGCGTTLPGNMAVAATGDTQNAVKSAEIAAGEITALGLNTNLAPDLNITSSATTLGNTSFSDDPDTVTAFGQATLQGIQNKGVAAAVKNFPGQGDAGTDSQTGLSTVSKTQNDLESSELIPFKAAVNQTDLVMMAGSTYPEIEKDTFKDTGQTLPAFMSQTIITGMLRGEMGYDGVVCTGALNTETITQNYNDPVEVATLSINAGADMLLMPVTVTKASDSGKLSEFIAGIKKQVQNGTIDEATIDAAVTRIVTMKKNRGMLDPDTRTVDEKITAARQTVGSETSRTTERDIADAGITVTANTDNTLPLSPYSYEKVLLMDPSPATAETDLQKGFDQLQDEGIINADTTDDMYCTNVSASKPLETVKQEALDKVDKCDIVVAVSKINAETEMNPKTSEGQNSAVMDAVIAKAHEQGKKVVIISARQPGDTARYLGADAVVAAYNSRDPQGSSPNIAAALDIIFGKTAPTGTLPVGVQKLDANGQSTAEVLYSRGYGITDLKKTAGTLVMAAPKTMDTGSQTDLTVTFKNLAPTLNEKVSTQWQLGDGVKIIDVHSDNGKVTWKAVDGVLRVSMDASDASDYKLTVRIQTQKSGLVTPLTLKTYQDARGRSFSPGVTGNGAVTVSTKAGPAPSSAVSSGKTLENTLTGIPGNRDVLLVAGIITVAATLIAATFIIQKKWPKP
ncbi:MAG: glycoside hydrolase family 3 N-terminal domain-containing protein [Eubacteriaceae bacterium]|nr:glycoside hydrolase family 3 N-terminal domain-containing protein [Eubacteriaceae bacterium]